MRREGRIVLNLYVVINPGMPGVDAATVAEVFPNRHHEIVPGRVWAVAGPQATCVDVCEALKLGGFAPESITVGIVVRMSEYNGYADRGLWERVRVWQEHG